MILKGENIYGDGIQSHKVDDLPSKRQKCQCKCITGDVILVKSEPSDIMNFLSLAEKTMSKTVQNLWLGAGYNIIAVPLAAGVLASAGLILSPAVGAILMSISTVVVALNAMTLRLN